MRAVPSIEFTEKPAQCFLPERFLPVFSRVNRMSFGRTLSTMNVYFVCAAFDNGPLTKIGKAKNLRFRMQSMQPCCPAKLTPVVQVKCESERAAHKVEAFAHEVFRPFLVRGEWFRLPAEWRESLPIILAKAAEFGRSELEELSEKQNLYDGSLFTRKNCGAYGRKGSPTSGLTPKKYCFACKRFRHQLGGKYIKRAVSSKKSRFKCASCVANSRELEELLPGISQ